MEAKDMPHGGRLVIFKTADYRTAPSNRVQTHLRRAGWTIEFFDPGGYRPGLKALQPIIDNPPDAVIRWEEQGALFKNKRWAEICAWAYEHNVAPLSVDYGYFDHTRSFMLDRYTPSGDSAICEEWASVPDAPIDWDTEAEPAIRDYRNRIVAQLEEAKALPPLLDKPYILAFLQFSCALCRLPLDKQPGENATTAWCRNILKEISSTGRKLAIKKSPLSDKTPSRLLQVDRIEGAALFDSLHPGDARNDLLNLRLLAHADWSIINCSSVSNIMVLCGLPVTALGRSWFVRAPGVFVEPRRWRRLIDVPTVNEQARNKWTRWWLQHQACGGNIAARLAYVLEWFAKSQGKAIAAPDAFRLPAHVRPAPVQVPIAIHSKRRPAVLVNDTSLTNGGKHLGCVLNVRNLCGLIEAGGMDIIDRVPVGKWDRGHKLNYPTDARIIVNGEGSIHDQNRRARGLLRGLAQAATQGHETWLVNHLSVNNDKLLPLYRQIGFVGSRDIATRGYLAGHGIYSDQTADCSFLTPPAQVRKYTDMRSRSASLLVCAGWYKPPLELVTQWAEALGVSPVYLDDFYPTGGTATKSASIEECFAQFASARFVLTSSFHGAVFATIHAVPFIPVTVQGPRKTEIAAAEAMGFYLNRAGQDIPTAARLMRREYDGIVREMRRRLPWFVERAHKNVPTLESR